MFQHMLEIYAIHNMYALHNIYVIPNMYAIHNIYTVHNMYFCTISLHYVHYTVTKILIQNEVMRYFCQ